MLYINFTLFTGLTFSTLTLRNLLSIPEPMRVKTGEMLWELIWREEFDQSFPQLPTASLHLLHTFAATCDTYKMFIFIRNWVSTDGVSLVERHRL